MSVEVFLSTLSLRRATNNFFNCRFNIIISIHALLAESDAGAVVLLILDRRFLSTLSLRRATLVLPAIETQFENFYPRSPCGERRYRNGKMLCVECISIHALLAESDLEGRVSAVEGFLFLSTLSLRRATIYGYEYNRQVVHFYPRSPCGERRSGINYEFF